MSDQSLLASLESWIEGRSGLPAKDLGLDPVPVFPAGEGGPVLAGVKIGEAAAVVARPDLVARLRPVVAALPPDMLFSPLGCYDLARVTLPEGFGIWGPSWLLFGTRPRYILPPTTGPCRSRRRISLTRTGTCSGTPTSRAPWADSLSLRRTGWWRWRPWRTRETRCGRSAWTWCPTRRAADWAGRVVSAAAAWILREGRTVMASVGPFNIPSARTLRSVGLRYLIGDIRGKEGPFRVPPQPLGRPLPGADVYDYTPLGHEP